MARFERVGLTSRLDDTPVPVLPVLGAPLVFVAIGLDSDRAHAPNERVDLSLLLRGAEVSAYLWEELASVGSDLR